MKVTFDWLKEFLEIKKTPQKIGDLLTMRGIEVEQVSGTAKNAILTLGLTPNKADCFSVLGVAREISAVLGKSLSVKPVKPPKGRGKIAGWLKVKLGDAKACPRYMARLIKGVEIKQSPDWLKKRLEEVGLKAINNVVDATNYVMWERGGPLHAFDHRFIEKEICIKRSGKKRKFLSLDGQEQSLEESDLLIWNKDEPVAIAGVMGGANSQIVSQTKDLVLEAAFFNPATVRRTSKRLGLVSESSRRFERGVDPSGVESSLHRLTELILEIAGGEASADWIDVYPKKIKPKKIKLEAGEVLRILGENISQKKSQALLTHLGFKVKSFSKHLEVMVPTYRFDIERPVDLIEEIARLYGYENLEETLPQITLSSPVMPEDWSTRREVKKLFAGLGFCEAVHLSFTSRELDKLFCPEENGGIRVENPISQEGGYLKGSLLPGLLNSLSYNLHRQAEGVKLFELRSTFSFKNKKPVEKWKLAALVSGRPKRSWRAENREYDFYQLKQVLEVIPSSLSFVANSEHEFLSSSQAARIDLNKRSIGWIGQIHPSILRHWELEEPVFAFELDWASIYPAWNSNKKKFSSLPRYPYVERDVALVVDSLLEVDELKSMILNKKIGILKEVSIFDVYTGKGVPEGKKSLAFSILYQDPNKTLTDEQVSQVHENLIFELTQRFSAELRK